MLKVLFFYFALDLLIGEITTRYSSYHCVLNVEISLNSIVVGFEHIVLSFKFLLNVLLTILIHILTTF